MITQTVATHALKVGAQLGEGPIWIGDALWFVDTAQQRIHRFNPVTRDCRFWETPEFVGWVLPTRRGGMIVGLQSGPHDFDVDQNRYVRLASIESEQSRNRLNDAAVDPAGRIWFGTMNIDQNEATGQLYCWDGMTFRNAGAAPVVATNGPGISPEGSLLYHVDSVGRRIIRHVIRADGSVDSGETFLSFDAGDGYPDGATCDAEGALWLCFYGGGDARRYAPDGTLTMRVSFPVANVTKLALGGPDGCTAYATTACQHLDDVELSRQPLAGDLFTFRAEVPAAPIFLAR